MPSDPVDEREGLAPADVRKRRRWLIAFSLLACLAVTSVATVRAIKTNDREKARAMVTKEVKASLVLERFELSAPNGGRAQGLVELVRREEKTSLRMIAVRLKPSIADEIYQVSLTGGSGESKLLGGEPAGAKGTFLARAEISADELHQFRRIEVRRVGSNTSGQGKLVLRARIPASGAA